MSGRSKFDGLRTKMPSAQRKAVAAKALTLRAEMALGALRRARQLTQETLSDTLHVGQAAVETIERRADIYVGNLRGFVEAMCGGLDIVARFPEGRSNRQFCRDDRSRGEVAYR